MTFQEVTIATARIKLNERPYYHKYLCDYEWDIMFHQSSDPLCCDLRGIKVGNTEEEGKTFCEKLKDNFKQAGINDGDRVVLLYNKKEGVRAIGRIGVDLWIDAKDIFAVKTFEELNIVFTSLKVH